MYGSSLGHTCDVVAHAHSQAGYDSEEDVLRTGKDSIGPAGRCRVCDKLYSPAGQNAAPSRWPEAWMK